MRFTYSPAEFLSCFQFGETINKVIMKKFLYKFVCRYTSLYLFSKLLQSELPGRGRQYGTAFIHRHCRVPPAVSPFCTVFLKPLQKSCHTPFLRNKNHVHKCEEPLYVHNITFYLQLNLIRVGSL